MQVLKVLKKIGPCRSMTHKAEMFRCLLISHLLFLSQSVLSSQRACTPSWVCMIARRSTCSCPSAAPCTSASSPHPFLFRPTTSLFCSCGPKSRSPSWPCWTTSPGPGLSTCTAPTQVRNLAADRQMVSSFWKNWFKTQMSPLGLCRRTELSQGFQVV